MIYLDNAATTYPKPETVITAVTKAMRDYSFNPGRGGYPQSLKASKLVYEARTAAKELFRTKGEEQIVFTSGCTQSLNLAIKGVLRKGDHVVISSFEHNSVVRPLQKLKNAEKITYSVANVVIGDDEATIENFRQSINSRTRLFVCTLASNAFGVRLPVERLCALAHSYNILFCLDAAQGAGIFPINLEEDKYDFVCCAGHKSLYGPMGTGLLLLGNDKILDTVLEGGTGSESQAFEMPEYYPDRLEAGTVNISGIAGLLSGMRFVKSRGEDKLYRYEANLIQKLCSELKSLKNITVYSDFSKLYRFAPVLSFNVADTDSETVARYLSKSADIAVRSGLHCAPLAHKYMGTLDKGTVRVAVSAFTNEREITALFNSLRKFS